MRWERIRKQRASRAGHPRRRGIRARRRKQHGAPLDSRVLVEFSVSTEGGTWLIDSKSLAIISGLGSDRLKPAVIARRSGGENDDNLNFTLCEAARERMRAADRAHAWRAWSGMKRRRPAQNNWDAISKKTGGNKSLGKLVISSKARRAYRPRDLGKLMLRTIARGPQYSEEQSTRWKRETDGEEEVEDPTGIEGGTK
ncbi:hypothetical protein B0H19DRAFT_1068317 [Mycena capillaripes]|nr:hypothetical protein B0H19DRAFT_1068317 [Mycena capillaripes]